MLDSGDGHVLQQFDLSTHEMIPSSFPYTVVATRDGRRAWCSLWNASRWRNSIWIREPLRGWIPLLEPKDPIAAWLSSHRTSSQPGREIALRRSCPTRTRWPWSIAASGRSGPPFLHEPCGTGICRDLSQRSGPIGRRQAVVCGRRLAECGCSVRYRTLAKPGIDFPASSRGPRFIPTDWYPSALAAHGDDLLIATAKGESTGPNNDISQLKMNAGAASIPTFRP